MFDLELLSSARTKSVISSLQLCSLFFFLAHMSQLRCSREEFHDHYRYAVWFRPFGLVDIHESMLVIMSVHSWVCEIVLTFVVKAYFE